MTTITVNGAAYKADNDSKLSDFIAKLRDCDGTVKRIRTWDTPVFHTYHNSKDGYVGSSQGVDYGIHLNPDDLGKSLSSWVGGSPDDITIDNCTLIKIS